VSEVRIDTVASGRDLKRFIRFPWTVYRGDPNWVPPLVGEMKAKLDRNKDPFFEHADRELFLARRGEEVTGRIAAIVDDHHNRVHGERTAFFGLYESLNDPATARALLEAAAAWGAAKGMEILRGPMNLSMNDECAFLAEGFDSPPTIMMPYNPKYYLDLMEACGLSKAKDLYAFLMSRDHGVAAKVAAIVERSQKETPFTLRTADMRNLEREAEIVALVYNSGWEKNWGFVPWTGNEMKHMVKKLKQIADPELVIFAERDGKPAGFALGLPNYNEILRGLDGRLFPFGLVKLLLNRSKIKGMRAAVFGLMPEFRQTGLSYLLYSELEKRAVRKGYEWGELSWQLEDNEAINRFAASIGARLYKRYRIYERKIAPRPPL
jgi:GNAT superfamily N-acetyltransferase